MVDKPSALFSIQGMAQDTGMSVYKVRECIRTLHDKKSIVIDERNRRGHAVTVLLPSELGLKPRESQPLPVDIESIDFYTGRAYVAALVAREQARCFYCIRAITVDSCVLDHACPLADVRDNSYRNIVAACHECNSRKAGTNAVDFMRVLYRDGIFSQTELAEQIGRLESLQRGESVPVL